ncbi:hypothetical protein O9K51_03977 [Purpureocillium lavendulum]|uniref:DUF1275 domain protein n=1 Tax=Purpureocillium lavendulum TaxID=1247861 RepID=A0AB34FWQ1_9HYPO|nr:hypothetical protein O9K51_03977 [Purpureocillium lavendulum]
MGSSDDVCISHVQVELQAKALLLFTTLPYLTGRHLGARSSSPAPVLHRIFPVHTPPSPDAARPAAVPVYINIRTAAAAAAAAAVAGRPSLYHPSTEPPLDTASIAPGTVPDQQIMTSGYGTAAAAGNGNGNGILPGDEEEPLLGGRHGHKPVSKSMLVRWRKQLRAEVSRSWADLVLLLCYVVTGLLDSSSTQVWGAFVSMQTGNTVYVGLGLASLIYPPTSPRLYKSGISLLSFCVGSFFFARFHRYFSPKRRWVLCVSFGAQALLTVAAACIVTFARASDDKDAVDWTVLVPLALVAFQSCGQAVTSRALKYNALTSVVLTSIYCDLFSDQDLFALHNVERNRRAAAPLLLLLGAIAGGVFSHSSVGIAGALWTAAAIKLAMVVMWFFWPAEPEEDEA